MDRPLALGPELVGGFATILWRSARSIRFLPRDSGPASLLCIGSSEAAMASAAPLPCVPGMRRELAGYMQAQLYGGGRAPRSHVLEAEMMNSGAEPRGRKRHEGQPRESSRRLTPEFLGAHQGGLCESLRAAWERRCRPPRASRSWTAASSTAGPRRAPRRTPRLAARRCSGRAARRCSASSRTTRSLWRTTSSPPM
eukprot:scaffold214_cov249-Pinguiococcus_pyrenoidosus.AAC.14